MNQTIEDLKTRRSIRKFKDEQISDEDLKIILKQALMHQQAVAHNLQKLL